MPLQHSIAIQTEQLTKKFSREYALNNLHLRVERGKIITILGPNGAGKTTLLRILATLARPTSGQILVNGQDLVRNSAAIRSQIGFLPHQVLLYGRLTVFENLHLFGTLYGITSLKKRIEECLAIIGITHLRHELTQTLSRGMQQRTAIARAILHDPDILLLDEPNTGLDQAAAQYLDNLLRQLHSQGKTILMTSHAIDRLDALETDIIILARGRIVFSAPRSGLRGTDVLALYENTINSLETEPA